MVSVLKQVPEPKEYVSTCVPTPALVGLNELPVTPTPDHVPPDGAKPVST